MKNPSSTSTVKYDGVKTQADIKHTAPADFSTGWMTAVSAPPSATQEKDIVPTQAEDFLSSDTVSDVDLLYTDNATDDLCYEWWNLDEPRVACVRWHQQFRRLLDTADTEQDFVISLSNYYTTTVYAAYISTNIIVTFAEQIVDFSVFADTERVALGGV